MCVVMAVILERADQIEQLFSFLRLVSKCPECKHQFIFCRQKSSNDLNCSVQLVQVWLFSDKLSGSLTPNMNGFHDRGTERSRTRCDSSVSRQPVVMVTMLAELKTSMS